jgi:hypothetical protein
MHTIVGTEQMSTCDQVRKIALALEGVEEVDHWGRPGFRTKKRIFITLRPNEDKAMFHIPEEHQELLFEMRPDAFEPLHWGKVTRCFVNLKKLPAKELEVLVREARDYAAPSKKLNVAGAKFATRTKQ